MEECKLLKERLQAITEKHRIQENIRQKKMELDQEKLELHRLKKKVLREQWLLQDSTSHNAAHATQLQSLLRDQQHTRVLQLNIHRTEMEVQSLEREESMISVNESFILNRLRTVEKSSEDIIKEAQDSFVPDQFQVTTVTPDVSPPASVQSQPNLSTKPLFAMEISVSKNLLTGQSKVLSTANVPAEDIERHSGLKVFDDGRKCVYALSPPQGSHDQREAVELSAGEVEELLRCATLHRQVHHLNQQNLTSREEPGSSARRQEADRVRGPAPRRQSSHCSDHIIRNNTVDRDSRQSHWSLQESSHTSQKDRNHQNTLSQPHSTQNAPGLHYGNQREGRYSGFQGGAGGRGGRGDRPDGLHTVRSRMNGSRLSGFPSPRSHDHRIVTANQQQLRYTPSHSIPYDDYVSVDEGQLYSHSPGYPPSQYSASHRGSAHCEQAPSPLYGDDAHYTILNAMDTTEPITAIFMGFQTALDDSGHLQEGEGALRAELVVIEDEQASWDGAGVQEKKSPGQAAAGGVANGKGARGRRTEQQAGPGIRKIQKKPKACCSVS